MKNNKSTILCPYCRTAVSRELFSYKRAVKNLENAVRKRRKENGISADAPLNVNEVYQTFLSDAYPKNAGWTVYDNAVPPSRRDAFKKAQLLAESVGAKPPVNQPPEARNRTCYVLNDFWYWCLHRVYVTDKHKGSPRLELLVNHEQQRTDIHFYDKGIDSESYTVALGTRPVCPNPHCNKILWSQALEITDDTVDILMIGDPSTGKTVWEVALTAFLQQRRNCGHGAKYQIAENAELILPESIAWRLERRSDAFLQGVLPGQTPTAQNNMTGQPYLYGQPNMYQGMTTDAYGNQTQAATAERVDERNAENLILILQQKNEQGKVISSRFVRICDYAGENARKSEFGPDDMRVLRRQDALFFFADIISDGALHSVANLMGNPQNDGLPYFAVLFPKVDEEAFGNLLFRSCSSSFGEAFSRVIAYRLNLTSVSHDLLRAFSAPFVRSYLHCSPEALAGFLCNHYEDRLQSVFNSETGSPAEAGELFRELTADAAFEKEFKPKEAKKWVDDLCRRNLYFSENPKTVHARPDEELRRLYTNFYLRNLLTDAVNFDVARKNAADIGLFPVSSFGKDCNFAVGTPQEDFDIDRWTPINLFDPLVWFLRQYII